MKLENKREIIETEDVVGENDVIKAGIDSSNLGFLFDIVSNQMYSDPIGSLIRELTSNCFDSHVEAKVDTPVRLSIEHDEDEGHRIEFEDFGVGISPTRMKRIYSRYFSSTKRETNDQHGMFGLGSKSPLAYCDAFKIITRFDGVEYMYVVHKGVEAPLIELIYEVPTEKRNGSCVMVPIKDGDLSKFMLAARSQLSFFRNVMFYNFGIDNRYTIYETENFKYRPDFQYSQVLHLCIGDVTYPIDWDRLGIVPVRVPVALKFNIGEIAVNPQREAIRYLPGVKEIILSKIVDVINELVGAHNKRSAEYYDLIEWMERRKRHKVYKIKIADQVTTSGSEPIELDITDLICTIKHANKYVELNGEDVRFYEQFKVNKSRFVPLDKYGIELPTNPFIFIRAAEIIDNIGRNESAIGDDFATISTSSNKIFEETKFGSSKVIVYNKTTNSRLKNEYIREIYGFGYTVRRGTVGRYEDLKKIFKLPKAGCYNGFSNSNRVISFSNYVWNYLIEKKGLDYDNMVVPKAWIKEKDDERREAKRLKKELEKSRTDIPVLDFMKVSDDPKLFFTGTASSTSGFLLGYDSSLIHEDGVIVLVNIPTISPDPGWNFPSNITGYSGDRLTGRSNFKLYSPNKLSILPKRETWEKDHIARFKGVVIYGFKSDYDLLKTTANMLWLTFPRYRQSSELKVRVIQISEKNKKTLREMSNAIEVNKFYLTENRILKKMVSAIKLRESGVMDIIKRIYPISIFQDISHVTYNSLNYIVTFDCNYSSYHEDSLTRELRKEILGLVAHLDMHDIEFDYHFNRVRQFFEGLELLKFTDITNDSYSYIIDLMKLKGKRLNYYHHVSIPMKISLLLRSQRHVVYKSRVRGLNSSLGNREFDRNYYDYWSNLLNRGDWKVGKKENSRFDHVHTELFNCFKMRVARYIPQIEESSIYEKYDLLHKEEFSDVLVLQ